jgi:hypothetical protein
MSAEEGKKPVLHNFIRLFPSICSEGEEQIIIFLHKEMVEKGRGE